MNHQTLCIFSPWSPNVFLFAVKYFGVLLFNFKTNIWCWLSDSNKVDSFSLWKKKGTQTKIFLVMKKIIWVMIFGGLKCCLIVILLFSESKLKWEQVKRKMKRKTVSSKPKPEMSPTVVTGIFFKPLDFAQVSNLIVY